MKDKIYLSILISLFLIVVYFSISVLFKEYQATYIQNHGTNITGRIIQIDSQNSIIVWRMGDGTIVNKKYETESDIVGYTVGDTTSFTHSKKYSELYLDGNEGRNGNFIFVGLICLPLLASIGIGIYIVTIKIKNKTA